MQKKIVEDNSESQRCTSAKTETPQTCVQIPSESGSSFQRCLGYVSTLEKRLSEIGSQLSSYGESIVRSNTVIIITNPLVEHRMPSFVKLIINIFLYILRNFSKGKANDQLAKQLQRNPERITLRSSLWNIISLIIKRKLFSCEPIWYYEQLSSMMVFRQEIAYSIFTLIGHQESYMSIQHFLAFCDEVNSVQSMVRVLPGYMYYLFGGSHLTISATSFSEKLKNITSFLSGYVNGQNIITEYVKSITHKKKDKDNQALERYIFLVSDFRKATSIEYANELVRRLFEDEATLPKSLFLQRVTKFTLPNDCFESNLLTKVIQFVRLEIYLSETDSFKKYTNKTVAEEPTQSRYYLETLDKLMNKCPFNGDQKCDCKKCQCVRRNRESAKNSQQKKRAAMEQLGPLQEKMTVLELKNSELEKQNVLLRSLLASLHQHPNFYGLIKENMEYLSKSMNNS